MKCFKLSILMVAGLLLGLVSCTRTEKIVRREIQFANGSGGSLRVMTFNIRYGSANDGDNHWGLRKDLVFDMIAGNAADVVGLQEALDFQVQDLKRALGQHYTFISAGRDDGEQSGEACPLLYRSDRYNLAESGTFWFSNTPWKPGSKHWGNTLPRICTWARLIEIETGKGLYVYNLHLDHQSQSSRQYSMDLLVKEIAKRKHPDPVIAMGDFNMNVDNPAMAVLDQTGSDHTSVPMVDVWQHLHPDQPDIKTYHAFGTLPSGPCLDHILIDRTVAIEEVAIDARSFGGRYPSDHFPVIAYLRVHAGGK